MLANGGVEEKRPSWGEWKAGGEGGAAGPKCCLSVQAEAPSKPVVRPYRPPTAQEVCYQRIQLAQQQAAQLAGAVQKTSLCLPGEKRRIAHVPNAALTAAAKQSKRDLGSLSCPLSGQRHHCVFAFLWSTCETVRGCVGLAMT